MDREAISEFQQRGDRIDLLLLDVVLPKINGPEAYARMIAERPDVSVIFATGYSPDIALLHKVKNWDWRCSKSLMRCETWLAAYRKTLNPASY
jgi:two-component system cell cycle sensor histidine kinase/response regulator CckA